MITAENLNDLMAFDHIIQVHDDGSVTDDVEGMYAPDFHDGKIDSIEWSLISGWTGQLGGGPVMHNSEYIGGALANHILSTPGFWVAVVCYWLCEHVGDCDCETSEGWGLCFMETPDE